MNDIKQLSGTEVCEFAAKRLKMSIEEFSSYFWAFQWMKRPSLEDDPPNWSMPEWEAAMLYALVRATKPKTILEMGTYIGYSASCMLNALEENGSGRIVTLDMEKRRMPDPRLTNSYRVFPLITDGIEFSKTLSFPIDMIFEDSSHTAEMTSEFLKNCLPHLKSGGIVVAHDVVFPGLGPAVTEGLRLALGDDVERLVIENSLCGLGFWIKP